MRERGEEISGGWEGRREWHCAGWDGTRESSRRYIPNSIRKWLSQALRGKPQLCHVQRREYKFLRYHVNHPCISSSYHINISLLFYIYFSFIFFFSQTSYLLSFFTRRSLLNSRKLFLLPDILYIFLLIINK